nr:O-antigen ligase family protein [Nocardioides sp. zg-1308]
MQGAGVVAAASGTGYVSVLSIVVAAVLVSAWPRLRNARRRVVLLWTAAIGLVLVVGLLVTTVLLGKELSTFSGRAAFWRAAIESTFDRAPLIGSGWGAVWEHPWDPTPPNDVANDIYVRADYALPHGHNFFVDVLPELGVLGVTIALVMVAYAVREVRRRGLRTDESGRLVLLVLVALLVSGITEPMLTVPLGWWSLTLVVATARQRVVVEAADLEPTSGVGRRRSSRGRRAAIAVR